jgi:hypothetical protein
MPTSKAAQGFTPRRTLCTSQAKTRGERRSEEKGPFMDGNELAVYLGLDVNPESLHPIPDSYSGNP